MRTFVYCFYFHKKGTTAFVCPFRSARVRSIFLCEHFSERFPKAKSNVFKKNVNGITLVVSDVNIVVHHICKSPIKSCYKGKIIY